MLDGIVHGRMRELEVREEEGNHFNFLSEKTAPLSELDIVLMRKDPPFDMEYLTTTYLLELVAVTGTFVVNNPRSLRDANEKLFTAWFPACCPPSLVTRNSERLRQFVDQHQDVIFKPLDGMGGKSIFRVRRDDPNINVIIAMMTESENRTIMAQRYISEIETTGDKRIFIIDGEAYPYALARHPSKGETRGNLAVGGKGEGVKLTKRDQWICEQVGSVLKEKGLLFVGIDVIGDFLTEINVTCPTCIREIDAHFGVNTSKFLFDRIVSLIGKA